PTMSDEETREALVWELDKHVTRPADDYVFDYCCRSTGENGQHITLFTLHADDLSVVTAACRAVGIKILAVESEAVALARMVDKGLSSIVIDLGEHITSMTLFEAGFPVCEQRLDWGSERFTRAIMESAAKSYAEAELHKRTRNCLLVSLDAPPDEMAVFNATEAVVEMISGSITQFVESCLVSRPELTISQVVLTGGGAHMESLPLNLGINLLWPVRVVSPLPLVSCEDEIIASGFRREEQRLSVAVCLAIRGLREGDLC
ncbi:MAG: pilus assembly protein PilM, partial [Negativicutes bacterium]|nr:pilus assembly protein PilM [Negativicutes bacterium]